MAMAEVVDHQSRNQVFGHLLGGCTRLAGGGSLGLSFRYAVCPGNFSSEGSRVPRSLPSREGSRVPRSLPSSEGTRVPRSLPSSEGSRAPRSLPSSEGTRVPRSLPSSEGSRVPRSKKIITSTGGASMNHWSSDTGTAKDGEEAEQEPGELQSVPLRKSRHIN